MTTRRDPDIMALDHAVRALLKSTPRMLKLNLDLVVRIIDKQIAEYRQRGVEVKL